MAVSFATSVGSQSAFSSVFSSVPMAAFSSLALAGVVAALLALGCSRSTPEAPLAAASGSPQPVAVLSAPTPVILSGRISRPAPPRLVAIGDLHGDLEVTRKVLRLAGAIDANDAWSGGNLVVVQTGDAIDRGDDDRAILDMLERLKREAAKAGGEFIALAGNHELMNALLDFRYVTPESFASFRNVEAKGKAMDEAAHVDAIAKGRAAAFAPTGPYATMIAERPIVMKVGSTVFVHGGVLPKHVRYGLDRMNDETHAWLLGMRPTIPPVVSSEDGPVWSRLYSAAPGREECAILTETLAALGATRMVMGHTVQRNGINPACDDHAWRIDTGLSKAYGGKVEALEIKGSEVNVLR